MAGSMVTGRGVLKAPACRLATERLMGFGPSEIRCPRELSLGRV